jgi:toxin ParE1/3/4
MVKLVWTEIAISDLNDIFDFIAVDSKRFASITVNKVYNRAQNIKGNTLAGRIVPEL